MRTISRRPRTPPHRLNLSRIRTAANKSVFTNSQQKQNLFTPAEINIKKKIHRAQHICSFATLIFLCVCYIVWNIFVIQSFRARARVVSLYTNLNTVPTPNRVATTMWNISWYMCSVSHSNTLCRTRAGKKESFSIYRIILRSVRLCSWDLSVYTLLKDAAAYIYATRVCLLCLNINWMLNSNYYIRANCILGVCVGKCVCVL